MRMSEFILANVEQILQGWEDFARSLPSGRILSIAALRNDAERMLQFIVRDLESDQSDEQQFAKSVGHAAGVANDPRSAAMDHGLARALDHFTLPEMVSEYRALRASVTRLWLTKVPSTYENVIQLVRFNEAIDQIVAESVVRFTEKLEADADLFTATVTHDLRNPINAAVLSARLLSASTSLSERDRAALTRIESSTARVAVMIRQLNDFTRVRLGGAVAYTRRPTDVARLCEGLVQEIEAAHPGRRIILQRSGDTTANLDGDRTAQLVANLLGNALQHGSPTGKIEIRVTGGADDVVLAVHNEGPPISPEELQDIFEPLHRGPNKRSQNPEGSLGLGLYIARTIALAHGGSIHVSSDATAGTVFTVMLPRTGHPRPKAAR